METRMTTNSNGPLSRAKKLRATTQEAHEALDSGIMVSGAFRSVAGYGDFARIQHAFHRDIVAVYTDPAVQALIPRLATRCRLPLVEADLADLGLEPLPQDAISPFQPGRVDPATALGWLYVAEGSNMGAALLRKEVAKLGLSDTHGASHLAPAPEGPAAFWRDFTAALDAVVLSDAEEARAAAGANAAFARVRALADNVLGKATA